MTDQNLLFANDINEVSRLLHGKPQWFKFTMIAWSNPEMTRTEAAIEAGYSKASAKTQASKLMQKEPIKKALQILQRNYSEEAKVTKDSWIAWQKSVLDRCMGDAEGYDFNATGANKALDNIAKAEGFYEQGIKDDEKDVFIFNANYGAPPEPEEN